MKAARHFLVRLLCTAALVLCTLPFVPPAAVARAAGPRIFFSEYIEGTGHNQALEIFNGTGAGIDLAAGGYNIQFYLDGSATAGVTINLTGAVANGDVYVVAHPVAAPAILAQADQTYNGAWFDGNDAVVLRKGTVRLDVIGQIGFDPGTAWGGGGTNTTGGTLRRNYCEGDPNGANSFSPIGWWQGYPVDTFSGLGAHSADCPSLPVPMSVLWVALAVMMVGLAQGVTVFARRRGVNLGIWRTFLWWIAAYVLLMPLAQFIAARGDARTMALAATIELAAIALVAGVVTGWSQRDRTEGVLQWILVIIVSYVPVALSFSDAGTRLSDIAGFSEWGVVLLSLVLYQAAFFLTHHLRRQR